MRKLRKGSIAWDTITSEYVKVLTKPGSGELPDILSENSGRKSNTKLFKDFVLVHAISGYPIPYYGPHYCNKPCKIRLITYLLTREEYLELKRELSIKSN